MAAAEYPEPKPPLTTDNERSSNDSRPAAAAKDAEAAAAAAAPEPSRPPAPPGIPAGFPEGGTQAWLTVSGAAACLFVSFGWVNCAGIFQQHYQLNQLSSYTPSEISWIPAFQGAASPYPSASSV